MKDIHARVELSKKQNDLEEDVHQKDVQTKNSNVVPEATDGIQQEEDVVNTEQVLVHVPLDAIYPKEFRDINEGQQAAHSSTDAPHKDAQDEITISQFELPNHLLPSQILGLDSSPGRTKLPSHYRKSPWTIDLGSASEAALKATTGGERLL
ncbi:uncharacterized protein LOC132032427 [Lycium ferocissimum]|uniref:uncharacterized protein LOC132032427 n=1 Tax=Lycium ferocissimum TaxID=112874 RepID=UPI0028160E0B|nr:uncharacterized protein LOC132032427 [Lycium ferocissimum]